MERICCISINHRTAPVDIRERIRVGHEELREILDKDSEAFALNTCNRTEVYWTGLDVVEVYRLIERLSGCEEDMLRGASEFLAGKESIRHLFMVASGLDSLVLGETQILGQMKDAYREALAAGTTDTILNKALHRAFRAAKRIRTETGIGSYPVSVASQAVDLAEHIFGEIGGNTVLVVGAGDMAGIAAKRLRDRGAKHLRIVNRTHATACMLADELGGIAVPFENLAEELVTGDIVITSTGSVRPIITRDMVAAAMKLRKNRPIIIIDIAVPRDVEEAAGKCYNCYLYDIDALKAIVDRHFAHRESEAKKAVSIIEEESAKFGAWLESLSARVTIRDLFALMDAHIADQLSGQSFPEGEKELLEQHLRASYKRLLHRPISFLKGHPGARYIEYVRRVFLLDEDYTDRHKG
ncbi:MAG TPA: glutamyl-tRNA reductase [Deltaproteobacteria bacterium]|nr:glutamyl-tRNA reductase [Deltaproteobacteria bacterium]HPR54739.1 glutamyl-tRNA reductase [Deltaproteobacteria bacterium]HXK48522.1 glutamyl-tRNA reductase [Deltaproteobacteria bacterium]